MRNPALRRRLRRWSILVFVLLALAMAGIPSSRVAAQGRGYGFIISDMPEGVIGSSTYFDFLRVLLHEPSQHSIDLKQYTRSLTGQSGENLYNLAGFLMEKQTVLLPDADYRGITKARFYAFIQTGSGHDYFQLDPGGGIPLVAASGLNRRARVQMRLCQGDDCKCDSAPQDCDYTWQIMWSDPGFGIYKTVTFQIPAHEDPPVRLLNTMAGMYAKNIDPVNDIHFRARDYMAYARRCNAKLALAQGCPSTWSWPGDPVAWTDFRQDITAGSGIQIYEPDGAAGWEFCIGNCPESRCGCYACDPPALGLGSHPARGHNIRWEPKYQVVQYYIDTGSFSGNSFRGWVGETVAAAELWNDNIAGQSILRRTSDRGDAQIVVQGVPGLSVFGKFESTIESVGDMADWDCDPAPSDASFVQAEGGEIHISTDESVVQWTADPIYISDVQPSVRWARLSLAHEFGHALGLGHLPLDCPNPPAPTATPFGHPSPTPGPTPTLGATQRDYPLMCARKYNTWRTRLRIDMQDYARSIECLTFRGDN